MRDFCLTVQQEASAVRLLLGCPGLLPREEYPTLLAQLTARKVALMRDTEQSFSIEPDAPVGAEIELGRRLGVTTPGPSTLFGLLWALGRARGTYWDHDSMFAWG